MMSGTKLSQQDRRDLEKFTKFLIYKSLQIIVQSRLGEKIQTRSKPFSSGADWFNLSIKDIPEVHAEAKKTLTGQTALLSQNVCVEISLKTAEGDCLVLETWYIGLNKDNCDPNVRVSYTVYNRMGIALKSLFSVSRVTPAYKLSRHQGACVSGYVICYRIYLGDPQFYMLGDGYQTAKVGSVPTPAGTITINLAYRTKLLISPQKSSKDVQFEVKDDHFKKDICPKLPTTPKPCSLGFRRNSTSEDLFQDGVDGQDLCSTTFSSSPGDVFTNGVMANGQIPHSQPIKINNRIPADQREEGKPHSIDKHPSFTSFQKVGAFVQNKHSKDMKSDLDEVPFCNLLQTNNKTENFCEPSKVTSSKSSGNSDSKSSTKKSSTEGDNMDTTGSTDSISSNASAPDDFVMVELKTPFAGADPNADLGKFYRECQGAPQLTMCNEQVDVSQTLEEITTQLEMFESDMQGFDDFVTSLVESVTD